MARVPAPALADWAPARVAAVGARLEALLDQTDAAARLAADPIAFARRYTAREDIEVAGIFASGLAFGRVAAFAPVIDAILAQADARGGPAAWVRGFSAADARRLAPLQYRWMRGPDLALLARCLQGLLAETTLEAAFLAHDDPASPTVAPALDGLVCTLRRHALAAAGADDWAALPRGFRYFLPRPRDGSACKRWCMLLRWLVRRPGPGAAGIDLGLWTGVAPARLVLPVDTHVHRITRLMGLTRRKDASWRTALELTAALRCFAPADPLRHDFALAHLGISGHCRGRFDAAACPACSLRPVCAAAGPGPDARGSRP